MKTWRNISGWFNYSKLYDKIIFDNKNTKDFKFVEVGVWMGKSILYFAEQTKKQQIKCKIYAIDNFKGNHGLIKIVNEQYNGDFYNIFIKNMHDCNINNITTIRKPSVEASSDFKSQSIDAIFIDANHSYDAVKKDIESWYPKVKNGGYIAGHDIKMKSVKNAITEFCNTQNIIYTIDYACWIIKKHI